MSSQNRAELPDPLRRSRVSMRTGAVVSNTMRDLPGANCPKRKPETKPAPLRPFSGATLKSTSVISRTTRLGLARPNALNVIGAVRLRDSCVRLASPERSTALYDGAYRLFADDRIPGAGLAGVAVRRLIGLLRLRQGFRGRQGADQHQKAGCQSRFGAVHPLNAPRRPIAQAGSRPHIPAVGRIYQIFAESRAFGGQVRVRQGEQPPGRRSTSLPRPNRDRKRTQIAFRNARLPPQRRVRICQSYGPS